ncbi:MAG: phosphoribosylformylglycinamidine synthase subunit PurQ [Actinomycetota bacterium]
MSSRVAITVFPGSNCEQDVRYAVELLGAQAEYVWHLDTDLTGFDAVVIPGGFAYGDYLRTGAIAAFSPVLDSVRQFALEGGPVLGICNGFQVLCEAGLLPGVLRRNRGLKFRCAPVFLRTGTADSPFTRTLPEGSVLEIPINHFEGNYYCTPGTLKELEDGGRIAFRYCDASGRITEESNPNGALGNIAGVISQGRNVLGMMPHPERAVDPELGGIDGRAILQAILEPAGMPH